MPFLLPQHGPEILELIQPLHKKQEILCMMEILLGLSGDHGSFINNNKRSATKTPPIQVQTVEEEIHEALEKCSIESSRQEIQVRSEELHCEPQQALIWCLH